MLQETRKILKEFGREEAQAASRPSSSTEVKPHHEVKGLVEQLRAGLMPWTKEDHEAEIAEQAFTQAAFKSRVFQNQRQAESVLMFLDGEEMDLDDLEVI